MGCCFVPGQVDCSKTCKHGYVVSKVKDTNLALVVADKPCGNCKEPKVSTAAVKSKLLFSKRFPESRDDSNKNEGILELDN